MYIPKVEHILKKDQRRPQAFTWGWLSGSAQAEIKAFKKCSGSELICKDWENGIFFPLLLALGIKSNHVLTPLS